MSLRKVDSILDLVGRTPLVRINRLNPNKKVEVYAKLEFMNPGGSIKDRPALSMIEEGEASGELTRQKTVLEATSGNTGIGLAMACAVKGYRMLFTMSESASEERKKILRAYGADILLTPAHLGTDGAIEEAYRLAREEAERYFLVDQYNNQANWRSHYTGGTADEIYEATGGKVSMVVATMGTTGTLMGVSRRMGELDPKVRVIGVEPYQGHKIQGLKNMKESYPPGLFDHNQPDRIVNIDDDAAYETARRLALEEGIFVGMSAGAAMRAALDQAAEMEEGLVVAILPDGGERYLSTPLFVSEKVPVPLKFYNTMTKKVDDLVPVVPGKVGIYVCGPSLDGPPDLGLCRRMAFADLVRRYLKFRRFEVKLIVNLADIDDRVVNQCLKEGADLSEFTARWEKAFLDDMAALGVEPASHYPKASDHVQEMIAQTRELLEKGLAYEKLRSVYFNISRFAGYGKLSHMDLNAMQSGRTVDYDYYEKDNPRDFTLFKRATLAELKAGIYWKTPWGNLRPGWHVECATMATAHLGQPFDIHMASKDLIFPHGDNEIAITEGLGGKPIANLWLHSEVVMAGGRKVARPGGADVTLRQLLEKGHPPKAVRYWLLSQHFDRVLNYEEAQLAQAAREVKKLNQFAARLSGITDGRPFKDLDQALYAVRSKMISAMDVNLNLPMALGHLFAFVKKINRAMSAGSLDKNGADTIYDFLIKVNRVLCIMDLEPLPPENGVEELVQKRDIARKQKDFAKADAIREELLARGIRLIDGPEGTRFIKK